MIVDNGSASTHLVECGRFAQAYVKRDLACLVVKYVWVDDSCYHVQYQSLLICALCSCYSHVTYDCVKSILGEGASEACQSSSVGDKSNDGYELRYTFKFKS